MTKKKKPNISDEGVVDRDATLDGAPNVDAAGAALPDVADTPGADRPVLGAADDDPMVAPDAGGFDAPEPLAAEVKKPKQTRDAVDHLAAHFGFSGTDARTGRPLVQALSGPSLLNEIEDCYKFGLRLEEVGEGQPLLPADTVASLRAEPELWRAAMQNVDVPARAAAARIALAVVASFEGEEGISRAKAAWRRQLSGSLFPTDGAEVGASVMAAVLGAPRLTVVMRDGEANYGPAWIEKATVDWPRFQIVSTRPAALRAGRRILSKLGIPLCSLMYVGEPGPVAFFPTKNPIRFKVAEADVVAAIRRMDLEEFRSAQEGLSEEESRHDASVYGMYRAGVLDYLGEARSGPGSGVFGFGYPLGVTLVIGGTGVGKSTVLDAMRSGGVYGLDSQTRGRVRYPEPRFWLQDEPYIQALHGGDALCAAATAAAIQGPVLMTDSFKALVFAVAASYGAGGASAQLGTAMSQISTSMAKAGKSWIALVNPTSEKNREYRVGNQTVVVDSEQDFVERIAGHCTCVVRVSMDPAKTGERKLFISGRAPRRFLGTTGLLRDGTY